MFYPLAIVKYAALITGVILGSFKIASSKPPKVEYMRLLAFPLNSKVMFVILVYFLMFQVALVDLIALVKMMVSS